MASSAKRARKNTIPSMSFAASISSALPKRRGSTTRFSNRSTPSSRRPTFSMISSVSKVVLLVHTAAMHLLRTSSLCRCCLSSRTTSRERSLHMESAWPRSGTAWSERLLEPWAICPSSSSGELATMCGKQARTLAQSWLRKLCLVRSPTRVKQVRCRAIGHPTCWTNPAP